MAAPLEDIRVLDLTRNVAGPYATKLLADYGADVLKLEPPDGDPARRFGPFPGNVEDPEASGLFLHLNTNKRSATVDPATAEGAATIRRLATECDVVIEDHDAGRAAAWGWGWDELSRDRDDLVMLSLTPFGQDGPYRDYLGSEITLQAMGGPLLLTGHRSREPLKFAGHVAHYSAGGTAALAILLARYRVEAGGAGDYIDLAVYECQAGFRDRRVVDLTGAAYAGVTMRRRTGGQMPASGIRPAMDGYINLHGFGARLPGFLALIGREDLITREELFQAVAYVPTSSSRSSRRPTRSSCSVRRRSRRSARRRSSASSAERCSPSGRCCRIRTSGVEAPGTRSIIRGPGRSSTPGGRSS